MTSTDPKSPSAWTDSATTYARSFAALCEGPNPMMVDDLGHHPGARLLDAGCGVGGLSRLAAERGWKVTAVDSAADMIAATETACQGLPVDVLQASVLDLPFPEAHFDAVVANFVINHVPDPRTAVRELTRVLRPGGTLALTIWTNQPTAQSELFATAIERAGAVPPPSTHLLGDLDFERTATGLASLVDLPVRASREIRWTWDVAWEDLWAGVSGGIATIGRVYLHQDQATRERMRAELRRAASRLEVGGRIRLPSVAAYLLAGK